MLGAKKARRLISPEIQQRLAGAWDSTRSVSRLFELVHRKQLDRRHAQLLQIRNFLDQPGEGAGIWPPSKFCAR